MTLDTPEASPMEPARFLGVDLGIVSLAVDSDGNSYTGTPVDVVRSAVDVPGKPTNRPIPKVPSGA